VTGTLLSVNRGFPRSTQAKSGTTGIDKRPVDGRVLIRPPGNRGSGPGSGLQGDEVFDKRYHGGADRALYAYGRDELDRWEEDLNRPLFSGSFGENLTTAGIDVNGALLGERWRVGAAVVLEVTGPRIPCVTFEYWMPEPHWVKRFTAAGLPGAYLRVVAGGHVAAGDPVTVVDRPAHDVSVAVAFGAMTLRRGWLPRLLALPERYLTGDTREYVEKWIDRAPSERPG